MLNLQFSKHPDGLLIVAFSGVVPNGSVGNTTITAARVSLADIFNTNPDCSDLLLDFSDLTYEFGDHIGSLWIFPLSKRNLKIALVATGKSAQALTELIVQSLPIPIFSSIADALAAKPRWLHR